MKDSEYQSYLGVAEEAAVSAGKLLMAHFTERRKVEYKGKVDIVTDMDRASEELIKNFILARFPNHSLIAEEGTRSDSRSSWQWFVDPLDGTTNYARGFPWFAVSIALCHEGLPMVGVVYNPVLDTIFRGGKGKGAFMNGSKLSVSKVKKLDRSFLATGFPYDLREDPRLPLSLFGTFSTKSLAIRRPGSASLDLSYIASGQFDGFWELGLHPWDIAAGIILIEEAGGRVTDFSGGPPDLYGREILATNGFLHDEMLDIIKTTMRSSLLKSKK